MLIWTLFLNWKEVSISDKYGRTHHFSFSLGATSDDRINHQWEEHTQAFEQMIHLEKLDGENNCIKDIGVFARSHAAPSTHPWSNHLKAKQSMIQWDLKKDNYEIFGENMYAIHSIRYPQLEHHFYVFGIRVLDKWLSWEETKFIAEFFDFAVVPELGIQSTTDTRAIQNTVLDLAKQPSVFESVDNETNEPCTREGVVSRNINEYAIADFSKNLFKYVRANHVKTGDTAHWTKNWKRAPLKYETNAKGK